MPESEFLQIFSNSILSHSKNRNGENRYVFIGKDGWKYRVIFSSEGYLIGMESLGKKNSVRTQSRIRDVPQITK
jgi:hypothetical protein